MNSANFDYAPDFSLPSREGVFRLSELNQRNRVALLFSHSIDGVRAATEQARQGQEGWDERDLRLVVVLAPECEPLVPLSEWGGVSLLRDERGEVFELYGVSRGETSFFLLGKNDFPVALRADRMPGDDELFALIDAMPMRQREMKKQA